MPMRSNRLNEEWFWVPASDSGYVPMKLLAVSPDEMCLLIDLDKKIHSLLYSDVLAMQTATFPIQSEECRDLLDVRDHLDAALGHVLQSRFKKDLYFTKSGKAFVAVQAPKHILPRDSESIAFKAVHDLHYNEQSQTIILGGECGSGKSFQFNQILQELADRSRDDTFMNVIPVIKAFCQASTNDSPSSSRYMVHFNVTLASPGAKITLLQPDLRRVVSPLPRERSFNIFYQLIRGASQPIKNRFLLRSVYEFQSLTASGRLSASAVQDCEDFGLTLRAMIALGFDEATLDGIYRVLSGILYLGNITYEHEHIVDIHPLHDAADILDIHEDDLVASIPTAEFRDELAVTLYSQLVEDIFTRINVRLAPSIPDQLTVSVLDSPGHEHATSGSFDTFCSNLIDETLHNVVLNELVPESSYLHTKQLDSYHDLLETFTTFGNSGHTEGFLEFVSQCEASTLDVDPTNDCFYVEHRFGWVKYLSATFHAFPQELHEVALETLQSSNCEYISSLFAQFNPQLLDTITTLGNFLGLIVNTQLQIQTCLKSSYSEEADFNMFEVLSQLQSSGMTQYASSPERLFEYTRPYEEFFQRYNVIHYFNEPIDSFSELLGAVSAHFDDDFDYNEQFVSFSESVLTTLEHLRLQSLSPVAVILQTAARAIIALGRKRVLQCGRQRKLGDMLDIDNGPSFEFNFTGVQFPVDVTEHVLALSRAYMLNSFPEFRTQSFPLWQAESLENPILSTTDAVMHDRFHVSPALCAENILIHGKRNPESRDEIYAQIIKQTTGNPSVSNERYGLKLLYVCLCTFPTYTLEMSAIVASHISSTCGYLILDHLPFDTLENVSSNCLLAYARQLFPEHPPCYEELEVMFGPVYFSLEVLLGEEHKFNFDLTTTNSVLTMEGIEQIILSQLGDDVLGSLTVFEYDTEYNDYVIRKIDPSDLVVDCVSRWSTHKRLHPHLDVVFRFVIENVEHEVLDNEIDSLHIDQTHASQMTRSRSPTPEPFDVVGNLEVHTPDEFESSEEFSDDPVISDEEHVGSSPEKLELASEKSDTFKYIERPPSMNISLSDSFSARMGKGAFGGDSRKSLKHRRSGSEKLVLQELMTGRETLTPVKPVPKPVPEITAEAKFVQDLIAQKSLLKTAVTDEPEEEDFFEAASPVPPHHEIGRTHAKIVPLKGHGRSSSRYGTDELFSKLSVKTPVSGAHKFFVEDNGDGHSNRHADLPADRNHVDRVEFQQLGTETLKPLFKGHVSVEGTISQRRKSVSKEHRVDRATSI